MRIKATIAIVSGYTTYTIGIVWLTQIDMQFIEDIFKRNLIRNKSAGIIVEKLGDKPGASSCSIIVSGSKLWITDIGIWIAVIPIMLLICSPSIHPNVMCVFTKFGCI